MIARLTSVLLALFLAGCASAANFDRLPRIGSSGGPELRVRIAYYPSASGVAYVVRAGEIVVYEFDRSRWSMRTVTTSRANEVLLLASDLTDLDRAQLECGIADGNAVNVEAFVHSRHFAIFASNPDWCPDAGSRRITALLQAIEGAVSTVAEEPAR